MKTQSEISGIKGLEIIRADENGGQGLITILGYKGSVVWSFRDDHVSFCPLKRIHIPTWMEMCELKDLFFYENETAVQVHPPKREYVNLVSNCLHLWGVKNNSYSS